MDKECNVQRIKHGHLIGAGDSQRMQKGHHNKDGQNMGSDIAKQADP